MKRSNPPQSPKTANEWSVADLLAMADRVEAMAKRGAWTPGRNVGLYAEVLRALARERAKGR